MGAAGGKKERFEGKGAKSDITVTAKVFLAVPLPKSIFIFTAEQSLHQLESS